MTAPKTSMIPQVEARWPVISESKPAEIPPKIPPMSNRVLISPDSVTLRLAVSDENDNAILINLSYRNTEKASESRIHYYFALKDNTNLSQK